MRARRAPTLLASLLLAGTIQTAGARDDGGLHVEFTGNAYLYVMRIVRSSATLFLDNLGVHFLEGAWLEGVGGGINADVEVSPRLRFNTGLGGSVWSPAQTKLSRADWLGRRENAWINSASATVLLGDLDRPPLQMKFGFFGFNTSPDAKDFGGYLYKGGCYPGYLYSGGGGASVAGLQLHSDYFDFVTLDGLVTLELEYPYFDFSFGLVPTFHVGDFLDVGAGLLAHRAIPAVDTLTIPTSEQKGASEGYTLQGTKAMARFSLDTRKAFDIEALGENDLKLYAEAAIMGVKNYPAIEVSDEETGEVVEVGYTDILERIPVMAGFNWPTHPLVAHGAVPAALSAFLIGIEPDSTWPIDTLLDGQGEDSVVSATEVRGFEYKSWRMAAFGGAAVVAGVGTFVLEKVLRTRLRLDYLTLEVEYYRLPHENHAIYDGNPVPVRPRPGFEPGQDDWRWAVLARKTLAERFTISAKVASDHFRTFNEFNWPDPEERILGTDEWYWRLTFGVGF
ncbi:MAG: hypothetical protein GF418_11795 [Chitinivibrionales bacterium]|nr:hypothetical protein [Chitinivibrionales bacterium]MBD3396299.1 hypothetical protein [Chitinivibrionales bacterium]